MTYTIEQVETEMSLPENARRVAVLVREDGDDLVAEWDGKEYRASNPFQLDSFLSYGGVPYLRNLYLMEEQA